MTEYDPNPEERRPFDPRADEDLREHGYIAVYRANVNHGLKGESVGVIYGHGPAVNHRPSMARELAGKVEARDDALEWLDAVDDPDALAADLRELAETVAESLR